VWPQGLPSLHGVLHYTVHRLAAVDGLEAALRVSLTNRRYVRSLNVSPIGAPESLIISLDRIAHREAVQSRAHLEHFTRHKHK
jgi:EAL domain-containing protein (putative c-di-GMP-specific phosphodiesterase class I)